MASGSESNSSVNRARRLGVTAASRRINNTPSWKPGDTPF